MLDLDETLLHSSFRPVVDYDFFVKVTVDEDQYEVFVQKRPGVDEFLQKMAQFYELAVFTFSKEEYANPVLDLLDTQRLIKKRFFRQHCDRRSGAKDLSLVGQDLSHTLIIDDTPQRLVSYQNNAIRIIKWFDDPYDTELLDMVPFLEKLTLVDDVRTILDVSRPWRVTHKKLETSLCQAAEVKNKNEPETPKRVQREFKITGFIASFFSEVQENVASEPAAENKTRLG